MSETIRSFIAIELPEDVRVALQHLQQELRHCDFTIKWVRPQGIHLTLKFLGDIESDRIEDIAGYLTAAVRGHGGVSMSARAIGVFPHARRPRVLWVGLAGEMQRLSDLQRRIDVALAKVGFKRDKRSFKGHLTLGRFKARVDSRQMGQALEKFADFETRTFTADRILLFKSQLKPTGAVYSILKQIPLGGGHHEHNTG
jgi:2'-5' RNA ligase